jgi:hypothetical protein
MKPKITPAAVAERTANALAVNVEFSAAACVVRTRPTRLTINPNASERTSAGLRLIRLRTTNLPNVNCNAKLTTPVTMTANASQWNAENEKVSASE